MARWPILAGRAPSCSSALAAPAPWSCARRRSVHFQAMPACRSTRAWPSASWASRTELNKLRALDGCRGLLALFVPCLALKWHGMRVVCDSCAAAAWSWSAACLKGRSHTCPERAGVDSMTQVVC